jgi:hypothetical protein
MDLRSLSEDAPESQWSDPMRDKVGAEQVHHCTTQTGGSGPPCGMPRWPSVVGGTRRRRSSPWSCGGTTPSMPPSHCRREAGSWSWAGSSSGAGRLRTAPLGRGSSGPRIWPSTAGDEHGDCRGDDLALLCFPMSVRKEVYEEPGRQWRAVTQRAGIPAVLRPGRCRTGPVAGTTVSTSGCKPQAEGAPCSGRSRRVC